MNQLLNILLPLSICIYLVFIWLPKSVGRSMKVIGDLIVGLVLVCLLLNNVYSVLVIVSLVWLVGNYLLGCKLPSKSILGPLAPCNWMAYNGFTVAALISVMN